MPGIILRDFELMKRIFIHDFQYFTGRQAVPLLRQCAEDCFREMDSKLAGSDGCIEVYEPFLIMATNFGLQFFAGAHTDTQRGDSALRALCKAARRSVSQFGGDVLFFLNLLPNNRLLHKIIIGVRSLFIQLPSDETLDRMRPIINFRREHPDATKEDVLQLLLNSEEEERKNKRKIEGKC
ncbi:uncharacterized protein LOC119452492 [Dermacentor silvarum]|uniref:uncharacterized protein LOC119452492 n=1 Tax=Dermacentor silvarum TaxID=543639 RepID=UPI0021008150|nr:uncharacterized protein LOC119452492 [Dermacentor silvarum]